MPLPPRLAIPAMLALCVPLAATPALAAHARNPQPSQSNAPEPGDPIAKRVAANQEQAQRAQEQLAANAASQKAHDEAAAAYEAGLLQHTRDQAVYDAAMKELEAKTAAYQALRAQWETMDAACKSGDDFERCQTLNTEYKAAAKGVSL